MDDDKLADVLEELPEDDQVEILETLPVGRAADVLEAMEPDDATDLLHNLTAEKQEELLQLMEPDEAADLRRLLTYDEESAGGMMTTEPVILGPEASIAEALAVVRRVELSPALASTVYVCRAPARDAHRQVPRHGAHPAAAARAPARCDRRHPRQGDRAAARPTRPWARSPGCSRPTTSSACPVVDADGRLIGAVTVDDVLDHILPDDWREERHEVTHG